ncbi:hypothetical protein [Streptomyces sp. NPDC020607]|uniref:hypothetical protein n=1 Tax=Streptomyces sp. NPDC020607 TaxID=3365082 RepID=UPI0037A75574
MTRAIVTAAPLLRHSDPQVIAATQVLLDAVGDLSDEARLEAALHAFGQAVRAAATPPPSALVRLTRRFRFLRSATKKRGELTARRWCFWAQLHPYSGTAKAWPSALFAAAQCGVHVFTQASFHSRAPPAFLRAPH